eukprot:m.132786 g.132786  ORF g.132786 m.132786 type:complete len:103 (+) comp23783_c0_seq2:2277-2585(+)
MPDVAIVYKLHLEGGKLINLHDWMQAFAFEVQEQNAANEEEDDDEPHENAPASRTQKAAKGKVDAIIQTRFLRAVTELQMLGFVKPTTRKTDHVQRLTWGYV